MDKDLAGRSLLTGVPGRDGFLFHDGCNQSVLQAPPGLLGLLEGRRVIDRWKPDIARWMDEAGHFFTHILTELGDQPSFAPVAHEVAAIKELDGPASAKSRFLFQYLTAVARQVERDLLSATRRGRQGRLRVGDGETDISLNGPWTAYYRDAGGGHREMAMQLPVNWELVAGVDSYSGMMRFTRVIELPGSVDGKRLLLHFSGVDYFADVWVNGYYAGGHEGFFGPFELDVSSYAKPNDVNLLRVSVASPNEPSGDGTHVTSGWHDFRPASSFPNRKTLIKGTLGHHDAKRGGAWSSLTSQDGNTGGIWNDVDLKVRDVLDIDRAGTQVTTLSLGPAAEGGDWTGTVRFQFGIRNGADHDVDALLRVVMEPANFDGPAHQFTVGSVVPPGQGTVVEEQRLSGLRPWQSWDQGHPHLYRVRVSVEHDGRTIDELSFETGLRILAVDAIGESSGPGGAFVVNGATVFVRGTNLLPSYWLSDYTDERVSRDFQLLQEAGFNAVMIHALVGPERLYREANRRGFLVVQMFPLQWTYDQSPDFVARAKAQLREMAAFLHNEPSVVSYEVHNEPDMRTANQLDNRFMDFELHATLRDADPHRWVTTFSGGNHAYPGQFYPLRDDNTFVTLPARFEEEEFHGRRISRHRNMPTEFGIQAMPNVELFREVLGEVRVRRVLARIRNDRKWLDAGGEPWKKTKRTLEAAKALLGGGSWPAALEAIDWQMLGKLGGLADEIEHLRGRGATERDSEVLVRRFALLLIDVLHYGAFKGENFWFGDWRPSHTLEDFVQVSQNRQYRMHKDAIESYLNAGATGPITGYFSFMFRDPDWEAPTWGVVDAAAVPKKAYRAYVESNQPVRVTLPQVQRSPVKIPGVPWFGRPDDQPATDKEPWVDGEVIVANDGAQSFVKASVEVWVEQLDGADLAFGTRAGERRSRYQLSVDLDARSAYSVFDRRPEARIQSPPAELIVADDTPPGTYHLKASVSNADRGVLSTNTYEVVVLDTAFAELEHLPGHIVHQVVRGGPDRHGFHFWDRGHVAHRATSGVKGLVAGFRRAREKGVDVYEAIQGEHFFRHILGELETIDGAGFLIDSIWTIRSEVISPSEKTAVLMSFLDLFARRGEQVLARGTARPRGDVRKGRSP